MNHDSVNHPFHYTQGKIECIDAIKSALTREQYIGFLKGQIIKYTWRAGLKDEAAEDQKKADWYNQRLITLLQGENNPNSCSPVSDEDRELVLSKFVKLGDASEGKKPWIPEGLIQYIPIPTRWNAPDWMHEQKTFEIVEPGWYVFYNEDPFSEYTFSGPYSAYTHAKHFKDALLESFEARMEEE